MAQRVITQLVDDVDGSELKEGKGETVLFGLDGVNYEIDLSDKNAKRLRDALAEFVGHARRTGRGDNSRTRSVGRRAGGGTDTKATREWARANGHEVRDRGRLPTSIVEAYTAAN